MIQCYRLGLLYSVSLILVQFPSEALSDQAGGAEVRGRSGGSLLLWTHRDASELSAPVHGGLSVVLVPHLAQGAPTL